MPRPGRTTTQRGYGAAHQAERKRWSAAVEQGLVRCCRCSRLILPGMAWDLDHTDDRTGYHGPAHRSCNRSAGARKGNRLRRLAGQQRATQRRMSARW